MASPAATAARATTSTARSSATGRRRRHAARLLVHRGAAPPTSSRRREVGRIAGERTVRRLGARQLGTLECPVLFEAPEAADLIGSFVGAVSGGSLYRKSSFLLDSLGTAGVRAARLDPRGAAHPARARQRAVRQRRRGDRAARRRARRRRAGLFPRQLLGAQARHGHDRQRRRQPQPRGRARRRRSRRRCCAGWDAVSSSPSSWARASIR